MLPRPKDPGRGRCDRCRRTHRRAPLTLAETTIQAQAPATAVAPENLTMPVTDYSGVLDASQSADLTDKIQQYKIDSYKSIYVYLPPASGA